MRKLVLSNLSHTWLIDLDGTLVKHNGYLTDGKDSFLDGALVFLNSIPKNDKIIFLTSRTTKYKAITINFLQENNIHYFDIIFNLPFGERILVNDKKKSGLLTAYAINLSRDVFSGISIIINQKL
jgi:hypothetical protein